MITLISGTNRTNSTSRVICDYYQRILSSHHQESKILDLSGLPADFTQSALYTNSGKNEAFNLFRKTIEEGQKFIFVVPEYNGSYPGVLKAFIDGLKYPDSFTNKKAALVGLSSGIQGGALALSHLSDVLSYLGMNLLGLRVKLARIDASMEAGKITNPLYQELLETQAQRIIEF